MAYEFVDQVAVASGSAHHRRAGLAALMEPEVIAVIGASRQVGSPGHTLFRSLFRNGFTGRVFPVNPNAEHVAGVQACARISDVPAAVDLAIICVPADVVINVARECAAAGVRSLLVISAGFAEVGKLGLVRQEELAAIARESNMRLVGPNSLGIVNLNPTVSMAATFAGVVPPAGSIGLLTQSGVAVMSLVEACRKYGSGLSGFVSVGNKADVSGNDLLEYWSSDRLTQVILVYLESFGNPRRFSELARRISRTKPIIALKSGRMAIGGKAASSYNAALATNDLTIDVLFEQAGVVRVDTVREMFDVARLLDVEDPPRGRRVAILSNSGGSGVMAVDACAGFGLEVNELTAETQATLSSFLDPGSCVRNPVDMTAAATAAQYERSLKCILEDDNVDAVVVVFTPLPPNKADVVARAVAGAVAHSSKPVVTSFVAADDEISAALTAHRVVNFGSSEEAIYALSKAAKLGEWRRRSAARPMMFEDVNRQTVSDILQGSIDVNGGWLDAIDAAAVARAYGLAVAPTNTAFCIDEAVSCAEHFGFPVVLKTANSLMLHKTEVGGVHLDLRSPDDVRAAYASMQSPEGEDIAVVVQPMVASGVELIVGAVEDPLFGPVVIYGLGGIITEALGDRSARLAPMTRDDARTLVRSLRSDALLTGHRGSPAVDLEAIEEFVGRVGALVHDFPQIVEIDCNPVIATADAAIAVDVKIRVQSAQRSLEDRYVTS
jgi:acetyl coenzyme A synthetase (ADP forming)-like protein